VELTVDAYLNLIDISIRVNTICNDFGICAQWTGCKFELMTTKLLQYYADQLVQRDGFMIIVRETRAYD